MKKLISVALILLVVGAIIWGIGNFLAQDDLAKCRVQPSENRPECFPANAIVAISGGDTTARTQEAISLYKNGWAPLLIFSGAARDKSGPSNAEAMRNIAIQEGVQSTDIIVEELGETTKQNAENTKNIFDASGIKSVILVTSGYHQRRAGMEFEKRAPDVQLRNHPVATDSQWSGWWWLSPFGWYLAVAELIKIGLFHIGVSG